MDMGQALAIALRETLNIGFYVPLNNGRRAPVTLYTRGPQEIDSRFFDPNWIGRQSAAIRINQLMRWTNMDHMSAAAALTTATRNQPDRQLLSGDEFLQLPQVALLQVRGVIRRAFRTIQQRMRVDQEEAPEDLT